MFGGDHWVSSSLAVLTDISVAAGAQNVSPSSSSLTWGLSTTVSKGNTCRWPTNTEQGCWCYWKGKRHPQSVPQLTQPGRSGAFQPADKCPGSMKWAHSQKSKRQETVQHYLRQFSTQGNQRQGLQKLKPGWSLSSRGLNSVWRLFWLTNGNSMFPSASK